jgi:acetolactate synthase-1/2/3 large subunit
MSARDTKGHHQGAPTEISVGQLVVRFLEYLGVDTLFGMPGAHILPVYDALHGSRVRSILVKHEQGAAFMAAGLARVSGGVGACITTAGPGASNLATGIAHAYADRLPVIAITAEAPTLIFGRGGLQESSGEGGSINQTALFSGITRYHKLIERTDYLATVLHQAVRHLLLDEVGPVVLSIPVNIQREMVSAEILDALPALGSLLRPEVAPATVAACVALLEQARRPLVLAGYGCTQSQDAREALRSLSDRLKLPVATSLKGKGAIDERSPFALGSTGVTSLGYARHYLEREADLVLMLGAGYNERTSYLWVVGLLEGKTLIQVDRNSSQLEKVYRADLAIQADLGRFLPALDAACRSLPPKEAPDLAAFKAHRDVEAEERGESVFDERFDRIKAFFGLLETRLEEGMILIDDNILFAQNWFRTRPQDLYIPNTGASSLGHAIPAAIGARLKTGKPVFAIRGDGGFQMCCMEIMTAVNYQIPLNILLFNNQTLGLIRKNQYQQFEGRFLDCDFVNPDFALLAASFGIRHFRIAEDTDAEALFQRLDLRSGINLIEFILDRDAYPNYVTHR